MRATDMQLTGRLTVADLIEALEDEDPDAEVRLAEPPYEYELDPRRPLAAADVGGTPVVYLVEAELLGYLPERLAAELGDSWAPGEHGTAGPHQVHEVDGP